MGLDAVVGLLACPVCGGDLDRAGAVLGCPDGHRFDVARQGYVNLLSGPAPAHADTAAMVAARERFLATGAYEPVLDAVAAAVADRVPDQPWRALDAGAGPGWYLAGLLDHPALGRSHSGRGLALDVSVAAAKRAGRRHERLGAVVGDTWDRLPVRDGALDVVLSVFAPRNPAEFARVLRPTGTLVVVAAEPDHLAGLRAELGLLDVEAGKDARLRAGLAERFGLVGSERVDIPLELGPSAVADLVAMGPNAFHADRSPVAATAARQVTAAVRLTVAVLTG